MCTIKQCVSMITCNIQMSIAGCFAHFVGDDSLVNTSVSMTSAPNDQTVDIPVWRTDTQVSYSPSFPPL